MAELTCPTVARILSTLLDCDLTNPGKEQAPICLSAAFMHLACLSFSHLQILWSSMLVSSTLFV